MEMDMKVEDMDIEPTESMPVPQSIGSLRPNVNDPTPVVRFVSIICVDRHIPETELMKWDVELQMMFQANEESPNRVMFGFTSEQPWVHDLAPQALPPKTLEALHQENPIQWTNLNSLGRFAWVDIPLPKKYCGYDGHLVLRYKREKPLSQKAGTGDGIVDSKVYPPKLTIINYMTYEFQGYRYGTAPTRARVVDTERDGDGNSLGVYTIHICDLYFNGEEIMFLNSFQQSLYSPVCIPTDDGEVYLRSQEEIIEAEMKSFCMFWGRAILDPLVTFHQVNPHGYIENANTASRPIHANSRDILMTQRARNKIIELRNRFKHVSSRQRYLHFSERDIFPLLLCQRDEVAALLKVSTTWLKDRIRYFGVKEWPARALMVHSSELRLALLELRIEIGGPNGVRERVSYGKPISQNIVDKVKRLHIAISKWRKERLDILEDDYLTPAFYEQFCRESAIWCLDPNWDAQPPWEYTHSDHNLGYGFGRLSVVRNYPTHE